MNSESLDLATRPSSTVYTSDELQFLAALRDSEVTIDISQDTCPDPDKLIGQLSLCLKLHRNSEEIAARLRPLIGRMLAMVRDNSNVYERLGYSSYEEFIRLYVCERYGLKRSALYEARTVLGDKLRSLSVDDYVSIGPTKAKVLSEFTTTQDSKFPQYLEKAKSVTATELRKWAVEHKMMEAGATDPVVIVINTSKSVYSQWIEFITMPEVHSHCGSSDPSTILKYLLMEGAFWTVPARDGSTE